MKNYIEIIYVDDNGLDHHVRTENVQPYKDASAGQSEMVYRLAGELSEKMRDFLRGKRVMKVVCPAGCGKKFISADHAKSHADSAHPEWMTPKRKGWATPYGFGDWKEPVTYEQACEEMKAMAARLWPKSNDGPNG